MGVRGWGRAGWTEKQRLTKGRGGVGQSGQTDKQRLTKGRGGRQGGLGDEGGGLLEGQTGDLLVGGVPGAGGDLAAGVGRVLHQVAVRFRDVRVLHAPVGPRKRS